MKELFFSQTIMPNNQIHLYKRLKYIKEIFYLKTIMAPASPHEDEPLTQAYMLAWVNSDIGF